MALGRKHNKTTHGKRGKKVIGGRKEAKPASRRLRRIEDKKVVKQDLNRNS